MQQFPVIFLAGPPGSGKTALGTRICREVELRFLDLSDSLGRECAETVGKHKETLEKMLLLVGLSLEEGVRELSHLIAAIQEERRLPPAECEGLICVTTEKITVRKISGMDVRTPMQSNFSSQRRSVMEKITVYHNPN